jgi:hypothetical protein
MPPRRHDLLWRPAIFFVEAIFQQSRQLVTESLPLVFSLMAACSLTRNKIPAHHSCCNTQQEHRRICSTSTPTTTTTTITIMSEDDSWRDTLFVWDGILVADTKDEEKKCRWEGTWVGVESADATTVEAPKRGAFDELVASDMHFHVTGSAEKMNDENETSYYKLSLTEGPGWDLGEGDEKKKNQDTVHDVYLPNLQWTGDLRDQRNNLIFACGKNDSGAFVSAGWMRPGNRLTLARRYVEDERSDWDLEQLRKAVLEEIYNEDDNEARIPPWQCSVMNAKLSRKRPRKEKDDDDNNEGEKSKES